MPRWIRAAAPSSVSVRPRTAEGKLAHPRRTYNLEMERFEIGGAILLTRSTSALFARCICTTRVGRRRRRGRGRRRTAKCHALAMPREGVHHKGCRGEVTREVPGAAKGPAGHAPVQRPLRNRHHSPHNRQPARQPCSPTSIDDAASRCSLDVALPSRAHSADRSARVDGELGGESDGRRAAWVARTAFGGGGPAR